MEGDQETVRNLVKDWLRFPPRGLRGQLPTLLKTAIITIPLTDFHFEEYDL